MDREIGVIIGADPGGKGRKFGLAALDIEGGLGSRCSVLALRTDVVDSAGEAIDWVERRSKDKPIRALGIDTLTEWSTRPGGWRPADDWLRERFTAVKNSVQSPNAMWGSVLIGGASVLVAMRDRLEGDRALVTEAHPKVCYFACTQAKHNWGNSRAQMTRWIEGQLGQQMNFKGGDDEFDACVAALAALNGFQGTWSRDLHALSWDNGQRISFAGQTHYFWPP